MLAAGIMESAMTLGTGKAVCHSEIQATSLSEFAGLKLPDGRNVVDLRRGELARVLTRYNVPGVEFSNGRLDNLKAYKLHCDAASVETSND